MKSLPQVSPASHQAAPLGLPPALAWPDWTDVFRWEPTDADVPAAAEAAGAPTAEDDLWWAAESGDADDEPIDRLAELSQALARLERGLHGDAPHDHAGAFLGHEA